MSEHKEKDIVVNNFNEESARSFREKVMSRSSIDPNMPIIVYVDSYGGNVDALNSMIATMHQVPNDIITVCIGKAMSCGAILLAAGDHRFCDKGSRVLIHEVSSLTGGPINELENDAREVRRLNDQMMNFLAERCNKTYKEIKAMMHAQDARDIALTAKQALEFGIVDYIGMPVIKPLVIYTIDVVPEHKYEKSSPSSLEEALFEISGSKKTKKKVSKKKTVTRKKKIGENKR